MLYEVITYYAAHVDPTASERSAERVESFKSDFGDADIYGDIRVTALGAGPVAPDGSVDVVLTFRNVHNWMNAGKAQEYFDSYNFV